MTFNMCHMSRSAFTKFEFGQLVHSWLLRFFCWYDTTLIFDPSTLNACNVSAVTCLNCIPNLSEIGQYAAPQRPKNIPNYATFNHPVKIRWQIWKLFKSERRPSIGTSVDVLDFGYFALFRNHSALKSRRIENGSQILHFLIWLLHGKI